MAQPSLLVRFGVLAFAVIATMGLLLGLQLKTVIADRARDNAAKSALVYVQLVKSSFLGEGLAGQTQQSPGIASPAQQSLSEQLLRDPVIAGEVLGATAWSPDGRVAFSTATSSIGELQTLPASAVEALSGSPVTSLAGPDRVNSDRYDPAEHAGEQVMIVDMPFYIDGIDAPVIVIELATDYTRTESAIRHDTAVVFGWLGAGLLALYLTLFRLVATASRRLRAQSEANRALAEHDALTGLANRTLLQEHTAAALVEAGRLDRGPALLLLDLDRFKEINDTLGHHHGDMLLRLVGPRLESVLGPDDHVARLGGDEFVVLLHDVASADEARSVAERLLVALDDPFPVDGLDLDVGGSLGIAVSPEHGEDFETLLQHADVAMYSAKANQTGITVYEAEHDRHSPARLSLLGELRRGIEAGQLVLHFQPQADLLTGAVLGVEALVRWQHPVHGLLAPDEFIPLAESTGAIRPLTLAVLDGALAFAAERQAAGDPLTVAVNISAHSLIDPDLTDGRREGTRTARRRRRAARPGDHRELGDGGSRARQDDPRPARRARRRPVDRRLRHGLLLARLPAPPPGARAQDRPVLRRRPEQDLERRDRHGEHRDGPCAGTACRRRGRRGPGDLGAARRARLHHRPGLPPVPARAGGRVQHLVRPAARRGPMSPVRTPMAGFADRGVRTTVLTARGIHSGVALGLATLAETNAGVAGSAMQTTQGVGRSTSAVQELARTSVDLRELVGRFSV